MSRTASTGTPKPIPQVSQLITSSPAERPKRAASPQPHNSPLGQAPVQIGSPENTSPVTIRRSSSSSSTSSTASSADSPFQHRSRLMRKRRPYGRSTADSHAFGNDANSDEDENPAFLPWMDTEATDTIKEKPNTTSEDLTSRFGRRQNQQDTGGQKPIKQRDNIASETVKHDPSQQLQHASPFRALSQSGTSTPDGHPHSSPKRRHGEGKKVAGGSESSPSMGSSFSDLSGELAFSGLNIHQFFLLLL